MDVEIPCKTELGDPLAEVAKGDVDEQGGHYKAQKYEWKVHRQIICLRRG